MCKWFCVGLCSLPGRIQNSVASSSVLDFRFACLVSNVHTMHMMPAPRDNSSSFSGPQRTNHHHPSGAPCQLLSPRLIMLALSSTDRCVWNSSAMPRSSARQKTDPSIWKKSVMPYLGELHLIFGGWTPAMSEFPFYEWQRSSTAARTETCNSKDLDHIKF